MPSRTTLFVCCLLLIDPSHAVRKPRKAKPKAPSAPVAPTSPSDDEVVTASITLTPYQNDGPIDVTDNERLDAVSDVLASLNAELLLRKADDGVRCFYFARERGDENNNPHSNGHIDYAIPPEVARDNNKLKAFLKAEAAWLKQIIDSATERRFRVVVKKVRATMLVVRVHAARAHAHPDALAHAQVNPKDRLKVYGYDQKDDGLAHFLCITAGLSPTGANQHKR